MRQDFKYVIWIFGCLITISAYAGSPFQHRAGIAFRSSYWHQRADDSMIQVRSRQIFDNEVNVDGVGGWLMFFSGSGENGLIVFSLGGFVHVRVVEEGLFSEQVDVQVISPILLGYQHAIFQNRNTSAFLPYVSAGGGPYVITHVHQISYSLMDDEVTVTNRIKPGAYVGLGSYFFVTDWFAFHGELRYHFVNFNPTHDLSGFEFGLGLAFSWRR